MSGELALEEAMDNRMNPLCNVKLCNPAKVKAKLSLYTPCKYLGGVEG